MRAIDHVTTRFPELAGAARMLYLRDERFRGICQDLALALDSLRSFEQRLDAALRPEVADYRRLVCELEEEVAAYLRSSLPD